ncbi:TPA: antitoxin [candidate division WOR-3 bacterium]|jgi:antitoxin StbD|uniref:Antitoxin n=1 Tax=candidate division WOR-3 bacterium TaxID=2052148 RepID=A0A350HBR7_UNCW3|nr:antitoxin [candidate division WOR-3 bacterium]
MKEIHAKYAVSVSDLKKNPSSVINKSGNNAVAILNHNNPVAYIVPPSEYEKLLEAYDELMFVGEVKSRIKEKNKEIEVELDEI